MIVFPKTLLAAPILFKEKKSQELKTHDFISSYILSYRTSENWDFFPNFLFPGFSSETFFPVTFLHKIVGHGDGGTDR